MPVETIMPRARKPARRVFIADLRSFFFRLAARVFRPGRRRVRSPNASGYVWPVLHCRTPGLPPPAMRSQGLENRRRRHNKPAYGLSRNRERRRIDPSGCGRPGGRMRVHVVGAGLAGLAAGLSLTARGMAVTVHEAGPAAGGRCRSYFDRELGLTIDNGNHLLLSGNEAAFAFLKEIGAAGKLSGPAAPAFPFFEPAGGRRWTLRLSAGRVPWWILRPQARVPGTGIADYVALLGLACAGDDRSVAEAMPDGPLYRRLVLPLAVAALNTPPEEGLARLLAAVMRETLVRGGRACLPRFPGMGLSAAFIEPALATLQARGAELRFGDRVAALEIADGRVRALRTPA